MKEFTLTHDTLTFKGYDTLNFENTHFNSSGTRFSVSISV